MVRIFFDTANLEQIKKYNDLGLVDGITANPTLLSKENFDPQEIMAEIVRTVKGPVSLEVISTNFEGMIKVWCGGWDLNTNLLVTKLQETHDISEFIV